MSYVFGGLIFKSGASLTDNAILKLVRRGSENKSAVINMEDATSSDFDGVGIARLDNLLMVFGIDIPHSCSFENEPLSILDRDLETLSKEGDILCFSVNGRMDTYAWSIYSNGKRVRTKAIAEGKILSDIGSERKYDRGIKANEGGMIKLIENFTGYKFGDLKYEKQISVKAYYENG